MKATNEQKETIKFCILKLINYYIDEKNLLRESFIEEIEKDAKNLLLYRLYQNASFSICFDDDNSNVIRRNNGNRLFDFDANFDFYQNNLNDNNIFTVLNSIKKDILNQLNK